MTSDLVSQLRRFWWAPLALLLVLELANPILFGILATDPDRLRLLIWIPFGVLMAAQLALVGLAWDGFREGSPYQALLGAQAALPLVWAVASRFLLPPLMASGRGIVVLGLWHAGRSLLEAALLGAAFHLRTQGPESAELGVTVSAGLAVMGGGWTAAGLAPLLALLWKDPLPFELCSGPEDQPRAAFRASLTGFLSMLAAPLLVALPWLMARGSANAAYGVEWLTGPALLLGALAWASLGARWDRRGRALRVLTRIGVGIVMLLILAALALLVALSGSRLW